MSFLFIYLPQLAANEKLVTSDLVSLLADKLKVMAKEQARMDRNRQEKEVCENNSNCKSQLHHNRIFYLFALGLN